MAIPVACRAVWSMTSGPARTGSDMLSLLWASLSSSSSPYADSWGHGVHFEAVQNKTSTDGSHHRDKKSSEVLMGPLPSTCHVCKDPTPRSVGAVG